jgi:hypothetical protein
MPEWVQTDELLPGDMMAVSTAKYPGNEDCSEFHPIGIRSYERSDGTKELRRGGGGFRDAVVPRLPRKWSVRLGWLLGAIEGAGFVGANDGIGLTNTTVTLLDTFEDILTEEFGLAAVRHKHTLDATPNLPGLSANPDFKPCWTTVATNQLAAEFLREARKNILGAPPQVRAAFFAGWIDTDGYIGPGKISLTVKHPQMWSQRQLLGRQIVQSLGIVPSKFDFPAMEVTGSRAVALASTIREFLVGKKAKAALMSSSEIGFDRGIGFACGQILHAARKSSGITFKDLGLSSGINWSYENGRVPVSERHLHNYIDRLGSDGLNLRLLANAECRWVQIKSIEPIGAVLVYDLVCEGDATHSFIANGLVTHNCVCWVDEAEKSLSGSQSSALSDAGTTSRTIGILSNWLQETSAPVCLAMTANSLTTLPIEFVNRMDERFFVGLPSEDERIEILKIHLIKRGQNPADFQLAELSAAARNMVGREIEQAIGAAMVESFSRNHESLDHKVLLEELRTKPRIFKTMVDEVKEILEWVGWDPDTKDGIRARFASSERSGDMSQFQFKVISDK